jgi:hypothetical protein
MSVIQALGLVLSATLAVAAAGGCNVSVGVPSNGAAEPTVFKTNGADAGDATASLSLDAGVGDAAAALANSGSPLCTTAVCDPDLPISAATCMVAPDGGPYDPYAGYGDAGLACRVQPLTAGASNQSAPTTNCYAAGSSDDGVACSRSSDCGPGFDCVGAGVGPDGGLDAGEIPLGSCRHYCCAGNSQCPTDEFCDVQPLIQASTTPVPVCMPIVPAKGCALLAQGDGASACPSGQTCTVVREDGATGCVEIGSVTALGSCAESHCAAGLACLGPPSARTCYTLCSTSASSSQTCVAPTTCQGGLPLFQDPSVGVCR